MNMNPYLGKKWFVFYTKVRPWLICFSAISCFGNFYQSTKVYFQNGWLMLSLVDCLLSVILAMMVFAKSNRDYGNFVDFVKGVLIYEVISASYQTSVQILINLGFGYALLIFVVCLIALYFLWYRLNINYFERRRLGYIQKDDEKENKISENRTKEEVKVLFCRKCGKKLEEDAVFCNKCGTKIIT